VTARVATLAVALLAIALVVAQDLYPVSALYHTWQYAAALALALAVMIAYANGVRRGDDGAVGKRLLIAIAGAALVTVAGLASGLLGPDTVGVVGTPGTVTPVPALNAAAFFGAADPAALARGSGVVTLRRRGAAEIVLAGGSRRLTGESLLYLDPRPAAFVEAFDAHGEHLTVTQPTNASFLSPVLLFRQQQRVGRFDLPFDTFATPARHRVLRALYFTPAQLGEFAHAGVIDTTRPGLVLTVSDDAGRPLGITLASSGQTVSVGGLRVRVTLGTYPALAIASAPPAWALGLGIVLVLAGLGWSALRPRGAAPSGMQPQGA
jgi:hypothetical protein